MNGTVEQVHAPSTARRLIVVPDLADRAHVARVKVPLRRARVPRVSFVDASSIGPMERASLERRLELWVDVLPPELDQYHPRSRARRDDLLGLMFDAGRNRAVLCTRLDWEGRGDGSGWLEDVDKAFLFDLLPVSKWNDRVCPRCRETRVDKLVKTEEHIWWCRRHATRVWEPIEHVEGVAWQNVRMLEVG